MKRLQTGGRFIVLGMAALLATAALRSRAGEVSIGSLEGVKVAAFAQILSDAVGRPFTVAGDVDATFSVVVPNGAPLRMTPTELYAFGLSVLASAGLTIVEESGACRIVRLPEGGGLAVGALASEGVPGGGLVTRVFRLEHVLADDVRRTLESGSGRKGWVAVLDASNYLVVTDTARTLDRVAALVGELDRPGQARVTEVVALQFADAEQLALQINTAAADGEWRAGQLLANRLQTPVGGVSPTASAGMRGALAVAAPHANRLILVGPSAQVAGLKALIAQLDVDTPTGRGHLNALPLQYLKAEEAAKSISALLDKSAAKSADGKGTRRISVEASVINNALLVDAAPNDFDVVKRLIEQLDRVPEQVNIAVMIVEVADSDGLTLGTELTALNKPDGKNETAFSGASRLDDDAVSILDAAQSSIFPQGLTLAMARSLSADGSIIGYPGIVNLTALRQNDKVEILSETTLQAQNNSEASVNIVDDIPILKSTIEGGSGSARDVIQNIERQEVGVKLKLTPHVIPGGMVRMELNPSIEAVTSQATTENQFTPTIAKRTANTTVTVPDGQTIVIAGLTRKDQQTVDRRIPLLGDIPLLGWLFRYQSHVTRRTNLLILVTPTILLTPQDAQRTTRDWRVKTGIEGDEPIPSIRPQP